MVEYIGIDLGGTNIRVGAIDKEENITFEYKELTLKNVITAQDLYSKIKRLIKKIPDYQDAKAIGVGVPGSVDEHIGQIISAKNVSILNKFPLVENLKKEFNKPIYIENDVCSRSNIALPENQIRLINELGKLNIPMVMILFNGRPLQLSNIEDKLDAILEVWFPGTMGAEAITEVILGEVNPSGKLTMSFPQNVGQCPIYYNHYNTGRPHIHNFRYLSRYQDIPTESFYPFGFGLSYCNFKYSNLKLDKKEIKENDIITVTVDIENQSDNEGYEVVQLYIQDLYGSVVRPVKELKSFKKEYFKPHETRQIKFEINIEMLKFWNEHLEYIAEDGEFKVYVGTDSVNTLEETFILRR